LLNVNSNQLNQSKIKNIEDGPKGSGFFFFFFYCKRRSGACCVVGFSCSKLRSRTSSGACCVATASFHAPEPKSSEACCVATSKLRSLLRCNSKLSRSGAEKLRSVLRCSKLQSRTSSGVCCIAAASSHALELDVATQQALMLWSLLRCNSKLSRSGAWCVAGFSCSKQAPKPRSSGEASELGACLPLQIKQTKIK
jgi:hypothetical protein